MWLIVIMFLLLADHKAQLLSVTPLLWPLPRYTVLPIQRRNIYLPKFWNFWDFVGVALHCPSPPTKKKTLSHLSFHPPCRNERFNCQTCRCCRGPIPESISTRVWCALGCGAGFWDRLRPLKTAEKQQNNPGKVHFHFLRQTLVCTKPWLKRDLMISKRKQIASQGGHSHTVTCRATLCN